MLKHVQCQPKPRTKQKLQKSKSAVSRLIMLKSDHIDHSTDCIGPPRCKPSIKKKLQKSKSAAVTGGQKQKLRKSNSAVSAVINTVGKLKYCKPKLFGFCTHMSKSIQCGVQHCGPDMNDENMGDDFTIHYSKPPPTEYYDLSRNVSVTTKCSLEEVLEKDINLKPVNNDLLINDFFSGDDLNEDQMGTECVAYANEILDLIFGNLYRGDFG